MSGEDQERFEDYLELEHYLQELREGRAAHPPSGLSPEQARIYQMAALFRAATPGTAEPTPEFAARLESRLEEELRATSEPDSREEQAPQIAPPGGQNRRPPGRRVSRRSLIAGGAAAAASLALGAGVQHALDHPGTADVPPATPQKGTGNGYTVPLIGANTPATWQFVTTLSELGNGAVRFNSAGLIGYVVRSEKYATQPVIAFSAACTHMGCIVGWQAGDRKFHCPCHGGVFTEYGTVDTGAAPFTYLTSLPRIETKVEGDKIFVRVPAPQTKGR
jgi:Rieske Fe-S protein